MSNNRPVTVRPLLSKTVLSKKSLGRALAGAVLLGGLAGCSGDELTRNFGLTRDAPDEFEVTTRAPLSMPPNYDLRPPRPGAPRPQEQASSIGAEAALVPQAALATDNGPTSPGQQALVGQAGPAAPADIRRKIEREAALDQPDRSLTDRLMFWKPTPPAGVAVDPAKEAARLRENAALGQSPQTADTPIIQRNQRSSGGLLDSIF
jgi:hypothetical protein